MNHTTQTPIYAVCAAAFIAFIVGLMVFAGPVAISAIFSACVVAQYISLSIPILCRLLGGQEWVPGVFDLGNYVSSVRFVRMNISFIGLFLGTDRGCSRCCLDGILNCYPLLPREPRPNCSRNELHGVGNRGLDILVSPLLYFPCLRWDALVQRTRSKCPVR